MPLQVFESNNMVGIIPGPEYLNREHVYSAKGRVNFKRRGDRFDITDTVSGTVWNDLPFADVLDGVGAAQASADALQTYLTGFLDGAGGGTPATVEITGQYLGSSTTFAGLPVVDALAAPASNGDWAILSQDDGGNTAGIYVYNGAAFSKAMELADQFNMGEASSAEEIAGTITDKYINPAVLKSSQDRFYGEETTLAIIQATTNPRIGWRRKALDSGITYVFHGGTWKQDSTPLNGKNVLYLAANPIAADGDNGDYALNINTLQYFGPKAGGAWPAGQDFLQKDTTADLAGTNPTSITDRATIFNHVTSRMDVKPYADTTARDADTANINTNQFVLVGTAPDRILQQYNGATYEDLLTEGTGDKNVISGNANPTAGQGVDGDEYYQFNGLNLYKYTKAGGAWGAAQRLTAIFRDGYADTIALNAETDVLENDTALVNDGSTWAYHGATWVMTNPPNTQVYKPGGEWNITSGAFPTINQTDRNIYIVTGAHASEGTVFAGQRFFNGDQLIQLVDNPSTTVLAGNWAYVDGNARNETPHFIITDETHSSWIENGIYVLDPQNANDWEGAPAPENKKHPITLINISPTQQITLVDGVNGFPMFLDESLNNVNQNIANLTDSIAINPLTKVTLWPDGKNTVAGTGYWIVDRNNYEGQHYVRITNADAGFFTTNSNPESAFPYHRSFGLNVNITEGGGIAWADAATWPLTNPGDRFFAITYRGHNANDGVQWVDVWDRTGRYNQYRRLRLNGSWGAWADVSGAVPSLTQTQVQSTGGADYTTFGLVSGERLDQHYYHRNAPLYRGDGEAQQINKINVYEWSANVGAAPTPALGSWYATAKMVSANQADGYNIVRYIPYSIGASVQWVEENYKNMEVATFASTQDGPLPFGELEFRLSLAATAGVHSIQWRKIDGVSTAYTNLFTTKQNEIHNDSSNTASIGPGDSIISQSGNIANVWTSVSANWDLDQAGQTQKMDVTVNGWHYEVTMIIAWGFNNNKWLFKRTRL